MESVYFSERTCSWQVCYYSSDLTKWPGVWYWGRRYTIRFARCCARRAQLKQTDFADNGGNGSDDKFLVNLSEKPGQITTSLPLPAAAFRTEEIASEQISI